MSSDQLAEAVEGVTKAALDWSFEKLASFVKKLKERKLAFIVDKKTIDVVREQYHSGESKFYAKYISNKELLFLVRMGLTLRKLEREENRLLNLRDKIYHKYGLRGLHIAQFTQSGVLNRYLGMLIEMLISEEDLENTIANVLNNIEKHTLFVLATNNGADITRKSQTIIDAHSPSIFVITGFKSAAKIVETTRPLLQNIMQNYELERFSGNEKEILFFKRKQV